MIAQAFKNASSMIVKDLNDVAKIFFLPFTMPVTLVRQAIEFANESYQRERARNFSSHNHPQ